MRWRSEVGVNGLQLIIDACGLISVVIDDGL